ncbi:baseplate/receptor binding protein [Lactococcus phage 38502]|nr:baseplate/receptor binding protein [Lactococcus phage 38502]
MEGELFIMLINIHDSHLEKVGFLDSESPGAPGFFNDVEHHYLAEGASTFTFSVNKKKNGILQDYCQFLNEYAYFSFSENGEDHFYSVGTVDEDNDTTFTVTCYSLNLELRLEQCDPLENTASHNIQWYFDQMELINNTQITIGINEVSDLSRVIKYDGQESKLARLISLIRNFDAEFEFITKSNNDGTLDKIILNIYKQNDGVNFQGVGTNRDDVILTLDTNITGVSRTVDKTQIFNATTITGADGLTWNSSEFSYVNSDGVEEFYKRKNADTAFAPLSLAKYPSQIQSSTGDRWIRKNFTTDYTSANAMWGYAVSQFKKFAYGIVTYKVSVSSLLVNSEVGNGLPLKIGDTVTISDDNFIDSNGVRGLILSARVSEMEISRTDPTKNTLVFSNYIRLQSQISNDLQSQLSNLVEAATPYRAELTTTNGTQFKNGTGSTTLSAHIFKGSATTETIADSYEWSKDGTVVAPTQTITVDASGVADKAVYSFKATVAGKVVASQSVTITNVYDGIAGKDGTGVKTTTITYAGSTSGTTAPTSGWNSQVPNVPAGQYLWTKTVWAYTDNTIKTGYSVGKMGNTGPAGPPGSNGEPGKIVSDTEPSTRFKGLTWKYSGTTDLTASDGTVIKPNTEYYYNGTHWVINYFSVNNFEAESITSDKINGKNLTITDGEFISKTTNGPVTTSTEIKDNHIAISKKDGTVNTRNDIALDSEQGLAQKFTNINTGFYRTAGINYQGPFTSDSDGNYAQLTPQGTKLSTDVPWTKLSLMNNFNGNIEYSIINGTVYISASGVGVPAMTAGQWKQAAQFPTGSSAIPIRANRIAAGDCGDGLSWALLSNKAGGIFIRCSANKAPTPNLFNATLPYPIG